MILRGQRHGAESPTADYPTVVIVSPEHEEENTGSPVDSLGMLAAEKLVADALRAEPDHFTRHFRLEAGMSPGIAYELLQDIGRKEGEVSELRWLGIRYIGEKVIEEVAVTRIKDGAASQRIAQITRMAVGVWKLDFSSYIRQNSHPWEDILSRKVETSVVRVNIAEGSYYNGDFLDDSKWRCYTISSPDIKEVLYGYIEAGSEGDLCMRKILPTDRKHQRATLEIRSSQKFMPRQFLITRFIAQDWIRDHAPNDAIYRQ